MNSQKYNKEELYPEDFSEDEKLQFDMYLEQAKVLFPKMANDEWLIQKGRPYIYSTATPPAIAHTLVKSLEIIEGDEGKKRRAQLSRLIKVWQDEMTFAGWTKSPSCTSIQPVILGSNASALMAAKLLDDAGYWIPAIRPPTVPVGSARLRITFSANHSVDDVRELIRTLKDIEQKILEKNST